VNHGHTWKGWERSGEKGLIISDNQAQTWLIITINDTFIGDLPLIINLSLSVIHAKTSLKDLILIILSFAQCVTVVKFL
jgi:hypothetical protein